MAEEEEEAMDVCTEGGLTSPDCGLAPGPSGLNVQAPPFCPSAPSAAITNKQKKKEAEKKKGKDDEKMEVDDKKEDKKEKMEVDEKKEDDKKDEKKEEKEKSDEPEPNFEMLSNPARVMKAQLKVVSLEDGKNTFHQQYNLF